MNFISLYLVKLHNAQQYQTFAQATRQYSIVISQKISELAAQDLTHAEILFNDGQKQATQSLELNSFDVNLEREPKEYTPDILSAIIEEEKYLENIYKKEHFESLYNISIYRVHDLNKMLDHLKDGSIFGHTVRHAIARESRKDCICTSCGYVHRHIYEGQQYFPESCPLCGAPQGAFVRRREVGGW